MTQTGREYAEALFRLARETNEEQEVLDSLSEVGRFFREYPEYTDFLASPNIPKKERTEAFEKAFAGKISEYVLFFVQLLCDKGHIRAFDDCVKEYKALYRASRNISEATVESAVPLTEEEKSKLKKKFEAMTGNSVVLTCRTDASVLGGIIVHIDGKILDGSLKHRLMKMKEVMENEPET